MSSQAVQVHRRPIDAGEGSNESKQPQEPKHPGDSDWGREGDDVDPVAAQVGRPTSSRQDSTSEFDHEDAGQAELDRPDLRSRAIHLVDNEP